MPVTDVDWDSYNQEILNRLGDFSMVYGEIEKQRPSTNGWVTGRCPFHEDNRSSFAFNTNNGGWCCHASCGKGSVFDFIPKMQGVEFKEARAYLAELSGVDRPSPIGRTPGILATYDYLDEKDDLLFQVVRKKGKKFLQRRPDGSGGWVWNLKGVRRVLYHLPDLAKANSDQQVFLVEGEKDADRLRSLGLLATCNPGGAGSWDTEYSEALRGRNCVILPDNDAPGRDHARKVEQSLGGGAASVKIVELPGLPEKGDVSDWLDAGGTKEVLFELVEGAASPVLRPVITVTGRQLRDVVEDTWRAILAANDPPHLFIRAGQLVRITETESGPKIEAMDEAAVYGLLIRTADWMAEGKKESHDTKPPKELARDILSSPHPDLPVLEAVLRAPVMDAEGRIIMASGYHPEARVVYCGAPGLVLKEIPRRITDGNIDEAVKLITEDLLCDFPFAAESDRAHAIAVLLLPLVRRMITGPTPMHLIEAPTPGTGKSLLADIASIIHTGQSCDATTVSRDESETRKKVTALLSRGRPIILLDNIRYGLDSSQLASAITAEQWSDRILGQTQMIELPNRAVWIATANNPNLSLEIARRCIRIRLDSGEDRPWQRKDFRHDPLRPWVHHRRGDLLHALLLVSQNWFATGMQPGSPQLGSFENWSQVIGGIIQAAGIPGFLDDTEEFYEAADQEGEQWRAFVMAWRQAHKDAWVTTADLHRLALAEGLLGEVMGDKSESSQRTRLGKALASHTDRRFGDYKVCRRSDKHAKVAQYCLLDVTRNDLHLLKGPQ